MVEFFFFLNLNNAEPEWLMNYLIGIQITRDLSTITGTEAIGKNAAGSITRASVITFVHNRGLSYWKLSRNMLAVNQLYEIINM